jgi:hypothetical protein
MTLKIESTESQSSRAGDTLAILILAGGSVNEKLRHLGIRAQSPALLPVHTRPLVAHVMDFYLERARGQIWLAVQEEHAAQIQAELVQYRGRFQLIKLPKTTGVVQTLSLTLAALPAEVENCIVNLVTSIPTTVPEIGEILVGQARGKHAPVAAIGMGEKELSFFFKDELRPATARPFTGMFGLSKQALVEACGQAERSDDLIAVLKRAPASWRTREVTWIDCGHEVNFYAARAQLIASRSFNRLVVEPESGIVRKRSTACEKLADEASYLQALPTPVSIYFPRLVAPLTRNEGTAEYAMEYYGYPNVAEYLLYWDLSPALWHRMFEQFAAVLRKLASEKRALSRDEMEQFYVLRPAERIEQFLVGQPKNDVLLGLAAGKVRVNGQAVRPLDDLLRDAQRLVLGGDATAYGGIMHGDFCFNNLLYDVASGIVRLIDPRGSFGGTSGIYGDTRYDLAKLMHSAVGQYDIIVNGLFVVRGGAGELTYAVGERPASTACAEAMLEMLAGLGADERVCRVLMGLLFVTMPPLHAENNNRQLVFFAHGLRILTHALN